MKPIEFKNVQEIDQLYDIIPEEELLWFDIKNLLIHMEDKIKLEFNINKNDELVIKPYKNQQLF